MLPVDPFVVERLRAAIKTRHEEVAHDQDGVGWYIREVAGVMIAVAPDGRYLWEEKP